MTSGERVYLSKYGVRVASQVSACISRPKLHNQKTGRRLKFLRWMRHRSRERFNAVSGEGQSIPDPTVTPLPRRN